MIYASLATGVLLAAGYGSRFDPDGIHNKLLARLPDGTPVAHESAHRLLRVVPRVPPKSHRLLALSSQPKAPQRQPGWNAEPGSGTSKSPSMRKRSTRYSFPDRAFRDQAFANWAFAEPS